jgi:uncharacterized membrane protein YuzA (DUF378 family)
MDRNPSLHVLTSEGKLNMYDIFFLFTFNFVTQLLFATTMVTQVITMVTRVIAMVTQVITIVTRVIGFCTLMIFPMLFTSYDN